MVSLNLPGRVQKMGIQRKLDCEDRDWEAAQTALAAAQAMPAGLPRIEALKLAGRMRFAATEKRFPTLTGLSGSESE